MSAALRLLVVLALLAVATAATGATLGPQLLEIATATESEGADVEVRGLATRSKVFDRYGNEIARLTDEGSNRELLALDDIADEVIQAVVSIEDAAFWDHEGVNLQAIARAAVENVGAGGISQGGSTITQQVIKNLVLSDDPTIERKVREAALAVRLENQYEKEELLELYLNTVYFGQSAYGVQAASEVYWGKQPSELGWAEAAMLAAIIRFPVGTNPIVNPDEAWRQRSIVLNRLADLGHITEEDARFYSRTALPSAPQGTAELPAEDYFISQIRTLVLGEAPPDVDKQFQAALFDVLGQSADERFDRVYRSGLRVYTTLDPEVQEMALAAQREILPEDDRGFTMAFASVEPRTGAVPALVGGPGFDKSRYNIATSRPGRQPGSSFKTFVLVAALETGYLPTDSFDGRGPCRFPDAFEPEGFYEVNNFGNSPGSVNTLSALTTSSSNCGYVGLGQVVGIENVIDVANRLGVTRELQNVKSLPLGANEVPPIDMASAYATIANGGVRNDPYFIERIETSSGEVIYQHEQRSVRAIKPDIACWAMDILTTNVQAGTGTAARLAEHEAGGKTGTTEGFGDAWFVGSTTYLTTAVWMGHPDTNITKMRNVGGLGTVTGGSFPARAWGNFNERYHGELAPRPFEPCESFTRGGRFVQGDGDFGGFEVCEAGTPYAVDTNGDGSPDACYGSAGGLVQCGQSGGFDEFGNPVSLYCPAGGAGTSQGGGAPVGQSQQEQQLSDGRTLACPASHPNGYDTDGDGVIDICYA